MITTLISLIVLPSKWITFLFGLHFLIHFLNFVFTDVFCQYNNAYNPYQQGYGGQGYVAQWPPRRPNQNQNYQYNQYYNQYGQNNRYPAYNQGSKEWVQTGVRWLRPEEAASARAGPVRNQYAPPVTRPEYNQYRPQYRPQYSRPDYNQQNYYTTYDGRRVDTSYLAPVGIFSESFTFKMIKSPTRKKSAKWMLVIFFGIHFF